MCRVISAVSRGLLSAIQRRGVTPLVTLMNFSGAILEVAQHGLLEQLRVQRGHAVDGVAADHGEVRHPHVPLAGLVDERQAPEQQVVAGKPRCTSSRKRRLIS